MIRIAGLDRCGFDGPAAPAGITDVVLCQSVLDDVGEIQFDLEPDDVAHAALGEAGELAAQQMAGREMKRPAVDEIVVAQHPAHARRPGQGAERIGIRHDDQVGRARHLVEPHAAAGRERPEHPPARRIQRRGRDIDVVGLDQRAQERGNGDELGPRRAVRFGPGEADETDVALFDTPAELGRAFRLVVRPKPVTLDEARGFHGFGLWPRGEIVECLFVARVRDYAPANNPCRVRNSIMWRSNSQGCSSWQA